MYLLKFYHSLFKLFYRSELIFKDSFYLNFFPDNKKEIGLNLIGWLETMVPRFERNFRNFCGENQTLKITSRNRQEIFERIGLFLHRNKWQEYKCTHRFCQIKKQIMFLLKTLYESKFLRSVHKEAINHTPKFSH